MDELDIKDTKIRRAQTGNLLVEIPGENANPKADSLATRLDSLFKDRKEVRVVRPVKKAEFHLLDLDDLLEVASIPLGCNAQSAIMNYYTRMAVYMSGNRESV